MREEFQALLRALPSVEELSQYSELSSASSAWPRSLLVGAVREVLASAREAVLASAALTDADLDDVRALVDRERLVAAVAERLETATRPRLRRVLNATGVVVHTNLGRSILPAAAIERVIDVASHYSTLEYRLEQGERGSRHEHVEELLVELTGAEAAMVVNNNAAAVLLLLAALAHGHEVIVSRGQLVEIGGSFRIPDIMKLSGARLVEVGTTNKTRVADYEAAITPDTALLLRVHSSNFKIVGFAAEARIEELAALGAARGIPVADDLGSGALAELALFREEPSVSASLAAGADIVTFSGDKLLGGPQAGVVLGRRPWVDAMKGHPLARAVRVDKMTLAALEGTLRLYRDPAQVVEQIPTLRYLNRSAEEASALAEALSGVVAESLKEAGLVVSVEATGAKAGGGALPLAEVPSYAVVVRTCDSEGPTVVDVERWMRAATEPLFPVVARVGHDALFLDMAALSADELPLVAATVVWAATAASRGAGRPATGC